MSIAVENNIGGTVAPGWEAVRQAFAANLANTEEVGAAVAAYHRGVKVVDLWGGSFDAARTTPYAEDTLQLVFSTTKGITAIAVGICVDRGLLDYDEKVSHYWPEFAAHGKGDATVAQLISHQCGLYTVDGPITLDEALDWATVTARLADTAPRWPIGTAHGYHALTYGWLAGELVRRVDPAQRSLGTFVRDEIVRPLGAELWVGLPESEEARVSPMISSPMPSDPAVLALARQFLGPGTPAGDALSLNGAFNAIDPDASISPMVFNSRPVHAAEIPAANGITNARSLARVYAATLAPVDGVCLLSDATRDRARTVVTPAGEGDRCLIMPTTFGMGFMTHGSFSPFFGPGSYGHPGAGGSVGCADPARELGFGYVMNQMATNLAGDVRAQSLLDACAGIVDAM
ncbi:MAG TPA: serine hydrolase domain-containing protein [Ilumatobacteraceae bacterium]